MFGNPLDFLKHWVIGMLQDYMYDQVEDLVTCLKHWNPKWFQDDNLVVPVSEVPNLVKQVLKALAFVIRHGKPKFE